MSDIQALRTEIKSWEHAFKAKHSRAPTVQDIRNNPDIAAKYKMHKKLTKGSQEPAESFVRSNRALRTPSPIPSSSRRPSSIVPKGAAVHSGMQSDANPFSPSKKRSNPSASKKRLAGLGEEGSAVSRPLGTVDAVSDALSVLETRDIEDDVQSLALAKRARKRLRGDPVSPSPNRPEKRVRKFSDHESPTLPPLRFGQSTDTSEDVEMSFIDESPVKPSAGKDFKTLFDEVEHPLPRLSFSSEGSSRFPVSAALNGVSGAKYGLSSKPTKQSEPKAQISKNAFGISNTSFRRNFANTLNKSKDNEIDKSRQNSDVTRQKRQSSPGPETENGDIEHNTLSISSNKVTLLPPSPTLTAQTVQKSSKSFASIRKKAKTKDVSEDVMEENEDESDDFHVIDLDMRTVRRRGHEDSRDSYFDDDLLLSMRSMESVVDQASDEDGEPDVDVPPDMQNFLDISNSRARERDESEVVDSLLQGRRRGARITRGEVWGAGEFESEDESGARTEGDDDWVGEGLPWEAAELSDFDGNV